MYHKLIAEFSWAVRVSFERCEQPIDVKPGLKIRANSSVWLDFRGEKSPQKPPLTFKRGGQLSSPPSTDWAPGVNFTEKIPSTLNLRLLELLPADYQLTKLGLAKWLKSRGEFGPFFAKEGNVLFHIISFQKVSRISVNAAALSSLFLSFTRFSKVWYKIKLTIDWRS